jgi:hypothetical protein
MSDIHDTLCPRGFWTTRRAANPASWIWKQTSCFPFHIASIRRSAGKVKFEVWLGRNPLTAMKPMPLVVQ